MPLPSAGPHTGDPSVCEGLGQVFLPLPASSSQASPPSPMAHLHPYHNGREVPPGWVALPAPNSSFLKYYHFSSPKKGQWEHPNPPEDIPLNLTAQEWERQGLLQVRSTKDEYTQTETQTTNANVAAATASASQPSTSTASSSALDTRTVADVSPITCKNKKVIYQDPADRLALLKRMARGISLDTTNPKELIILDAIKALELQVAITMQTNLTMTLRTTPVRPPAWRRPQRALPPCEDRPLAPWEIINALQPTFIMLFPHHWHNAGCQRHLRWTSSATSQACPCCRFLEGDKEACKACFMLENLFGIDKLKEPAYNLFLKDASPPDLIQPPPGITAPVATPSSSSSSSAPSASAPTTGAITTRYENTILTPEQHSEPKLCPICHKAVTYWERQWICGACLALYHKECKSRSPNGEDKCDVCLSLRIPVTGEEGQGYIFVGSTNAETLRTAQEALGDTIEIPGIYSSPPAVEEIFSRADRS